MLEELAVAERRGASGDPDADRRDAELAAHCRLFAEALATEARAAGGPAAARVRAAAWRRWARGQERGAARWRSRRSPPGARRPRRPPQPVTAAASPEPDELRVSEAAAVWAHVSLLAEALEHALGARPGASA